MLGVPDCDKFDVQACREGCAQEINRAAGDFV